MLPTKVKQVDYSEIETIVHNLCNNKLKDCELDCVFTTSVSGTFVASLISKKLNIPMKYSSKDDNYLINNYQNILLVDLICYDNQLNILKDNLTNLFPNKIFYTCGVLADNTNSDFDFFGLKQDVYYLTPWNIGSYTPNSHLNRLLEDSKEKFEPNQIFIGFSSRKCFETIFLYHDSNLNKNDVSIFDEDVNKKITSSKINTNEIDIEDHNLSIQEYYLKNKPYFLNKINFINNNGITHFYDDSLKDSLILSVYCPITKISFVDLREIYQIKAELFSKS